MKKLRDRKQAQVIKKKSKWSFKRIIYTTEQAIIKEIKKEILL